MQLRGPCLGERCQIPRLNVVKALWPGELRPFALPVQPKSRVWNPPHAGGAEQQVLQDLPRPSPCPDTHARCITTSNHKLQPCLLRPPRVPPLVLEKPSFFLHSHPPLPPPAAAFHRFFSPPPSVLFVHPDMCALLSACCSYRSHPLPCHQQRWLYVYLNKPGWITKLGAPTLLCIFDYITADL